MGVAEVDLAAEHEDLLLGGRELARGFRIRAGLGHGLADLELAGEVVSGGLVAVEIQLAGGLEGFDVVLERVAEGVVQDGSDPAVDGLAEGFDGDLGAFGVVEPGGGDDRGQADAWVLVADGLVEQFYVVRDLPIGVADDVDRGGPGLEVRGFHELLDERDVGFVLRPRGP